jgi:Kef-type K+ transport system membrane component KefB
MIFGYLALIAAAALFGPFLSGFRRLAVPVVVGEILGGALFGHSGLGWINADSPTIADLSVVGFAMLMLMAGTHLPFHDPNLRKSLRTGLITTALSFGFAAAVGIPLGHFVGVSPQILVLLLANSSAAVLMPIVHERKLDGPTVVITTTWVALTDTLTIGALPLVMATGKTLTIGLGALAVTIGALAAFVALKAFRMSSYGDDLRKQSKEKHWALDLRMSVLILLALSFLATQFGTSILLPGFACGAIISLVGKEPRRFAKQLIGLAEGFFVPLFFVTLGAKLDVSALFTSPENLKLLGVITAANIVVHVIVAKVVRLPYASGLAACAQLGLPAAVASLGLSQGILQPGQGAAVVGASMLSILVCTIGSAILARNPANIATAQALAVKAARAEEQHKFHEE